MYKLAFIATGYIVEYDGVSVFIENVVYELLKDPLVKDGLLEIDIYLSQSAFDLFKERLLPKEQKNIKLISIKDTNPVFRIFQTQIKVLRKKYDVVFMPNPMPLFWSRGRRVKVIHDLTIKQTPELFSPKFHKYIDFLIWYMYRFDDAIGYISKQTKDDIANYYEIDVTQTKMLYLPNGIPFKVQNHARPNIEDVYKKYDSDELELVVVGRINRSKGFDRIIKFLKYFDTKLGKEYRFKSVVLHIVGKQTPETAAIFHESHLEHIELDFCGFVDDDKLNSLYKNSHFCFFLSRNEGYGLPLVESMWLRTIPVLSDIPIFSEILGDSYPKFNDQRGYEDAILSFINQIFDDKNYMHEIFDMLEKSVENEKIGYQKSAQNLISYIKSLAKADI